MSTPNTAIGNAFAELMKNQQITETTMNDQTQTVIVQEQPELPVQMIEPEETQPSTVSDAGEQPETTALQVAIPINPALLTTENIEEDQATFNKITGELPGEMTIQMVNEYPDPEVVLDSVEVRQNTPRHKKPSQKPMKENLQPQKAKPALFALSENRPASAFLKNIFDTSTIDGVDGVDHINIHNDAVTELGRLLDMNAKTPFTHPELGSFHCVGGLWHYIKTRPMVEEYRILHGAQLRYKVSQMKRESMSNPEAPQPVSVNGFKTIVADAMWHKVTQDEKLVNLMAQSTLPFEHYFNQGALNLRQYPSEGFWIVAAYEKIREAIKHRLDSGDSTTYPDFTGLDSMRNPRAGIEKPHYKPQQKPSPYGKPRNELRGEGSYFNRAR